VPTQQRRRAGDRHAERLEGGRDALFVLGVLVRVQKTDGDRVDAGAPEAFAELSQLLVARTEFELTACEASLVDPKAQLARHQDPARRDRARVELGAILPGDLDEILEARIGHERDARSAPRSARR
jgi:hypothetical protein